MLAMKRRENGTTWLYHFLHWPKYHWPNHDKLTSHSLRDTPTEGHAARSVFAVNSPLQLSAPTVTVGTVTNTRWRETKLWKLIFQFI